MMASHSTCLRVPIMTAIRYRPLSRLVLHSTRQRGIKSISRMPPTCTNLSQSSTRLVRWHSSAGADATGDPQGSSIPDPSAAAGGGERDSFDRSRFTTVVEVRMPDMGSGDGNKILQWHKAEGDLVRTDDVLCDIETADFAFGMECEDEDLQIMGKILVEAPSGPVPVNQVICTLLHETKEVKAEPEAADPKPDSV